MVWKEETQHRVKIRNMKEIGQWMQDIYKRNKTKTNKTDIVSGGPEGRYCRSKMFR